MEYFVSYVISLIYKIYNYFILIIYMFGKNDYLIPIEENIILRIKTSNKLYNFNSKFYFERYFDSRDIHSITMEKHYNMNKGICNENKIHLLQEKGYSYYINFNPLIHMRTKRFIERFNNNNNIVFIDIFSKSISMDKHHDSSNRHINDLVFV